MHDSNIFLVKRCSPLLFKREVGPVCQQAGVRKKKKRSFYLFLSTNHCCAMPKSVEAAQ